MMMLTNGSLSHVELLPKDARKLLERLTGYQEGHQS
jgi:hypothetical protein